MLLPGAGASSAYSSGYFDLTRVFPTKAISTLVALGRGLEEVYSVPQTLPDSIARALARLESATKTNPAHGLNERPSGEGVADSRGPGAESDSCLFFSYSRVIGCLTAPYRNA